MHCRSVGGGGRMWNKSSTCDSKVQTCTRAGGT